LFDLPSSPTEITWRDSSYDPKTDRFLMTRPPAGSDEHRQIGLSLGWSTRLAGLLKAKRDTR